ncbi:hypothetical protein PR202_gb17612 [Eleusine coracana subsp. coracana]|uniref:Uncharacterized protein n=1 Tax=Eleusine coracana subsp. coracana TaxID=191504 RepID=A0AAV5F3F8_ELECO|nr:hypothetical protein PR202_gb17612 [Eleusine coracana subsp. coracana]
MLRASETAGDLWAKAAELERDFAGYKRRLAEKRACAAAAVAVAGDGAGGGDEEEEEEEEQSAGRGRRYEEYVRRRDERLRQEWRVRMERKEAEMKALWARLDRAAGSRSRRGGDGGELAAASRHDRDQDYVNLQQKPANLEVKVKPPANPVTPRCTPATKLTRPRTSVPSSPGAASPRLSTSDARRRPSQLLRQLSQAEPPATPRKENRLPPPASMAPATPRPRTALSRSKSMVKDGSSFSSVRQSPSPRPPRFHPARTSCDGVSNVKDTRLSPDDDDAIGVVMQRRPCFSEDTVQCRVEPLPRYRVGEDPVSVRSRADTVHAQLKQVVVCAVAPEPLFHHGRSRPEPASSLLVTPKDEPDCSEISPASCSAGNKCNNNGDAHRSSDKSGSSDITGDSDTEPSYVYIKRDRGEQQQTPRASQVVTPCPGTCPQHELRSQDEKDTCNFEGTIIAGGESPMADAEEESRRASSESLYSNVRSSFSQRSDHDHSATNSPLHSPLPSCTTPPTDLSPVDDAARPKENTDEEDTEKNTGSSVTVSITVQSPMDAMAGLKRFLTFGKKNGKAGEAATTAVVERSPRSLAPAPPAGDRSTSRGCDSVKARTGSTDSNSVVSNDLDNSHVISPHGNSSIQAFMVLTLTQAFCM